jgi:hypothetical protein
MLSQYHHSFLDDRIHGRTTSAVLGEARGMHSEGLTSRVLSLWGEYGSFQATTGGAFCTSAIRYPPSMTSTLNTLVDARRTHVATTPVRARSALSHLSASTQSPGGCDPENGWKRPSAHARELMVATPAGLIEQSAHQAETILWSIARAQSVHVFDSSAPLGSGSIFV